MTLTPEQIARCEKFAAWLSKTCGNARLAEDEAKLLASDMSALLSHIADQDKLIAEKDKTLKVIGDFAHDKSTGPAVEDGYWEIRDMAYSGLREATK